MTNVNLRTHLAKIIGEAIAPMVKGRSCWLLEVPYYNNIGDTLIWQGEMDFLNGLSCRCRGVYSFETFHFPEIGADDLILFQGGGNFGDLWHGPHEFKMKVVGHYPKNEFLFFPQTIYFEKRENLRLCADFLAQYNCTICARDKVSYELLRANFRNRILLVPDMAFCMDMKKWDRPELSTGRSLFLRREDKEFKNSKTLEDCLATLDADITDWPTMCAPACRTDYWYQRLRYRLRQSRWLYDRYMYSIYRPYLIRSGVRLINSHTDIYTTRLHACILSILLGKEKIAFFDNSYGKNSSFYDTWLTNCENVKMVR